MNSSPERNLPDGSAPCEACQYTDNLDILRNIPVFSGIPVEELKVLAILSKRKRHKAGEVLFNAGDVDGKALFILQGAGIVGREIDGELMDCGKVEPGTLVGGLSLLSEVRRLFTLTAESDMICLHIPRDQFTAGSLKAAEKALMKALIEEIVDREEKILEESKGCGLGVKGMSLL